MFYMRCNLQDNDFLSSGAAHKVHHIREELILSPYFSNVLQTPLKSKKSLDMCDNATLIDKGLAHINFFLKILFNGSANV